MSSTFHEVVAVTSGARDGSTSFEGPDPLISGLNGISAGWRQLADLELSGRAMVTFMRGHMAEAVSTMSALEYFRMFYTEMAREFVQADDDGFVTHHCLRTLFDVWRVETQQLISGPAGASLGAHGLALGFPGSAVREGRRALAASWYAEVMASLGEGATVLAPVEGNPIMPAADCKLKAEPPLLWAAFLNWSTATWARQIVVVWDIVAKTIAMRRACEERGSLSGTRTEYAAAVETFQSAYAGWRAMHLGSVEVHDSMPRGEYYGAIGAWLNDMAPDSLNWTIKQPMKTEMYREVASSVALLRGEPTPVAIPAFQYWRRTHWTPACIAVGASGMPPFG